MEMTNEAALTFKITQEYPKYWVGDVYMGEVKLYRTTKAKPIPTDAENYQRLQDLEKPINITDEEKKSTIEMRSTMPKSKVLAIKESLENEANTQQEICKKHKISVATLRKIKAGVLYDYGLNREDYGLEG